MNKSTNLRIKNNLGLEFKFLESGLIKSIDASPIRISLKKASLFSKAGANIYLRKKSKEGYKYKALLGAEDKNEFTIENNTFFVQGVWEGVIYTCRLILSQKSTSWQWIITTKNTKKNDVTLDLINVQDVGLKKISDALVNEYYVSQYLERLILKDEVYGPVICCRQNFKDNLETPWLLLASKNGASASTDGMQFYGKTFREKGIPEGLMKDDLGGECSAELSIVALQETPFTLASEESHTSVFIASYVSDHPEATSRKDLDCLPQLMEELNEEPSSKGEGNSFIVHGNKFNSASFLPVNDLNSNEIDSYFSEEKRHVEEKESQLLSFFYKENSHVVLKVKETLVDRPHGHILQAKAGYTPDENIVSTTAYACGIFNSHITQGNTNFNRFLSLSTSQFNLENETGQRIFVTLKGKTYLLGIPSAFEMGLNHCRWIYKIGDSCFQIRTWTSKEAPQVNMDFKVLKGEKIDLLITNNFDESIDWKIIALESDQEFIAKPNEKSLLVSKFPNAQFRLKIQSKQVRYQTLGSESLYFDGKAHGGSFLNFKVDNATHFCMSFLGEVVTSSDFVTIDDADLQWNSDCVHVQKDWKKLSSNLQLTSNEKDISVIQDILPWYGINALTHLLTPHGLEQFDGAAWGTRDTTQGPFELLLCTEKYDEAKEILRIIFSHQNSDGGWPQWWMFDSYSEIRAGSSHGDIHHWCIIALANYIKATGDINFLSEELPYYHEKGETAAEKTPLLKHVERLIDMLIASFIHNTALVPFGGGDWNDSMQPASKTLAKCLISSWTVALNYQAFTSFQNVYEVLGATKKATRLKDILAQIKSDFNKYLIKDNVVAGHGLLEDDNSISLLLHPTDSKTNIQYRLLPMIRGIISGIFTKEQAMFHQNLIEIHLKGPDGARLMNRPPKYNGGIQTIFQRAESSSYFGREIGIMYMHAHLRYAQTQAIMGNAKAFIKALRQANPIAYNEIVTCGDLRQSNCYYSSSDVVFKNRYEADERYEDLKDGKSLLKGGWRIYSSGPGIYMGLVVWHLLGLRTEFGKTIIDPVIPKALDGLSASLVYSGYPLNLNFSLKKETCHPKTIHINGKAINFTYEDNQYRKGGAEIETKKFLELLTQEENTIDIVL